MPSMTVFCNVYSLISALEMFTRRYLLTVLTYSLIVSPVLSVISQVHTLIAVIVL